MSFGYVPSQNKIKNLIKRIVGWPAFTRRLQAATVRKFLRLQKDDIFLDVGCGGGNYVFEMSRHTRQSVGLEINYGSLAGATIAQRNFPNVHLICGDGLRLPLSDSSIDKILLSGTFQSVQNDRQLLCECNRVLKPNGIIVITVISQHVLAKRIHSGRIYESFKRWYRQEKLVTRYYGKAELSKIFLETGFRIVNAKYAPNQLASAVLDLLNFISFRTGLHFNQRYIFLAFYPLLWLIEKFSKNTQQGNELIVSAKKGIATQ